MDDANEKSVGDHEPSTDVDPRAVVDSLQGAISCESFNDWYHEQQFSNNILEGKSYFNGPSPSPDPKQHTPSQLLQCYRKAWYKKENAPQEGTLPQGLFWIGTEFEETVIVPYLQDIAQAENLYVQNSVWINETAEINGRSVQIKGSTDPVIVTANADPVLVTEIKTTADLSHISAPKDHHLAQLHAYLYSLDQEFDYPIRSGLVLYGSRKTLDVKVFAVQFDEKFWERVQAWMVRLTEFRETNSLPPADPEFGWECNFCSFKHRCGQADTPYGDVEAEGLLPLFDGYDRKNLVEYLEAHTDIGAKLTPTLAHRYPTLVDEYGAYDWSCPACTTTYGWNDVNWSGNVADPPACNQCLSTGEIVTLSGPDSDEQLSGQP